MRIGRQKSLHFGTRPFVRFILAVVAACLATWLIWLMFFDHAPKPSPIYLIVPEHLDEVATAGTDEAVHTLGLDTRMDHIQVLKEAETSIATNLSDIIMLLGVAGSGQIEQPVLVDLEGTPDNGRPSVNDLKHLRSAIEQAYRGQDRVKALQRVVVVLDTDRHVLPTATAGSASDQALDNTLVDRLIYIRDNFGGLGLHTDPEDMNRLEDWYELIHGIYLR